MYARIFDEKDDINIIPEVCMERYRTYCRTIKLMGLDRKMTTMFEVNECFIHADCHWKAIFVKDGCTVVGNNLYYINNVMMYNVVKNHIRNFIFLCLCCYHIGNVSKCMSCRLYQVGLI